MKKTRRQSAGLAQCKAQARHAAERSCKGLGFGPHSREYRECYKRNRDAGYENCQEDLVHGVFDLVGKGTR